MKAATPAPPPWCSPLPRAPVSIRVEADGSGEDDSVSGEDYRSICGGGTVTAILSPKSASTPLRQLRAAARAAFYRHSLGMQAVLGIQAWAHAAAKRVPACPRLQGMRHLSCPIFLPTLPHPPLPVHGPAADC